MRAFSDLRALWTTTASLFSEEAERDDPGFDLAVASQRFSATARDVVDDKLTFSATLMRAGEVAAARQLLAEVEEDVRNEQIALIETVNEVKVKQAASRDRITRKRLARTLVTAVLGSSLMAFSAAGMAVAGMFQDRSQGDHSVQGMPVAPSSTETAVGLARSDELFSRRLNRVKIGHMKVALDDDQLEVFRKISAGGADPATVEEFLQSLPSSIAREVRKVISGTVASLPETPAVEVPQVTVALPETEQKPVTKKKSKKGDKSKAQPKPEQPSDPSEPTGSGGGGNGDGDSSKEGDGGNQTTPPLTLPGL